MAERDSATAFPLDRARVPTAVSRTLSGSERVNEFSRQRVLGAGHSLLIAFPSGRHPASPRRARRLSVRNSGTPPTPSSSPDAAPGRSTSALKSHSDGPTWVVSLSAKPTSSAPLGGPEREY